MLHLAIMEPEPLQNYLTIETAPLLSALSAPTASLTKKKSRFLAYFAHVESPAEAASHLEALRSRHMNARHHVSAYILADGSAHASDDGEPSRTAGTPVLEVLKGACLADVSAVVVRYFGGVLLGTGGLIRAYSEAVRLGLAALKSRDALVQMCRVRRLSLEVPYELYGPVSRLCEKFDGRIVDATYAETVTVSCSFIAGKERAFITSVQELFKGKNPIRLQENRGYAAAKGRIAPDFTTKTTHSSEFHDFGNA